MKIPSIRVSHIVCVLLIISLILITGAYRFWTTYTEKTIAGDIDIEDRPQQTGEFIHRHKIVLEGETFLGDLLDVLYRFRDYHGIEIELEGFVQRKEHYDKKQFTIARVLMTCCEEDTEILGLLSHWDFGDELSDNTWVRITGNLQSIEDYDEVTKRPITSPIIIVQELEIIEEPEDPYIYP